MLACSQVPVDPSLLKLLNSRHFLMKPPLVLTSVLGYLHGAWVGEQTFPDSYKTGVGEGGFQLSGGQKQVKSSRVCSSTRKSLDARL